MIKNLLVSFGLMIMPITTFAGGYGVSVGGYPAAVGADPGCAVAPVASATYTQTVQPVQVVSPQVIQQTQQQYVQPQAVVTQNAYTQQVLGTGLIQQQQVVPTVSYQPAAVATVATSVVQPVVVQQYNMAVLEELASVLVFTITTLAVTVLWEQMLLIITLLELTLSITMVLLAMGFEVDLPVTVAVLGEP